MDFLGDLLGGAASVASGGLFGLFGSLIGVGAKYFQEKQRQNLIAFLKTYGADGKQTK